MLDFFAVHDLAPFPEDLPSERTALGSMDIAEYHACSAIVEPCLASVGVEASYFADWTVPPDRLDEVLTCLGRRAEAAPASAREPLAELTAIIRRARGLTLLAVCD